MGKVSKNKNGKVPKITEEEYAEYILTLKGAAAESLPSSTVDLTKTGTNSQENKQQ